MVQASIAKGLIGGHLPAHRSKTLKLSVPHSSLWFGSEPKLSGSGCLTIQRVFQDSPSRISLRISASVTTAEKPSTVLEIVLQLIKEITGTVKLPGSKSLSNRILLLAALSEETLGTLMEQVVSHLQLVTVRTKQLNTPASVKKELKGCMHTILLTITNSMTPTAYFKAITLLLGHADRNVRNMALGILCETVKGYDVVQHKYKGMRKLFRKL